jgi:muconolactone delta-isomerase
MDAEKVEGKVGWAKTSDDPVAYALGEKWGLAGHGNMWTLFAIKNAQSMFEVEKVASSKPPFEWAERLIEELDKKRATAKWEERDIGKRVPGEEGNKGGRLIL